MYTVGMDCATILELKPMTGNSPVRDISVEEKHISDHKGLY